MNCKNLGKIFLGTIILSLPLFAQASETFNVDSLYDYNGRSEVSVFLHQVGQHADFYVEDSYYQTLDMDARKKFTEDLKILSQEFDQVIYPRLTIYYGSEWNPGIDENEKVTVLLTRIKSDYGGYFNEGDEYLKAYVSNSNEKEMLYFNVFNLGSALAKSYLAHEFTHLITFNQKNRQRGLAEDVWLNEMRAELAPTLLGYDDNYEGSNLQKRVKVFSQKPGDSLVEWKNESLDYGVINLFGQYLLDYYGVAVLKDSLQSDKTGIASLNYALAKNNFSETFSDIFSDWLTALFLNDCSVAQKFCYLNQSLKSLKISPKLNYLPSSGETNMTVIDYTKDWSGNWIKFFGGNGTLKIEFIGEEKIDYKAMYLLIDSKGNYSFNNLTLDKAKRGMIFVSDFGKKYDSLILIPFSKQKMADFEAIESYHKFIWSASIVNENSEMEQEEEAKTIAALLAQVDQLKLEIARTQAKITEILSHKNGSSGISCQAFQRNLAYGESGNEIKCLQEFLKLQGGDIYPEALITGNFLSLTRQAVIRFQEKHSAEILSPLGLSSGTGIVGLKTREKINSLLGY